MRSPIKYITELTSTSNDRPVKKTNAEVVYEKVRANTTRKVEEERPSSTISGPLFTGGIACIHAQGCACVFVYVCGRVCTMHELREHLGKRERGVNGRICQSSRAIPHSPGPTRPGRADIYGFFELSLGTAVAAALHNSGSGNTSCG